MICDVHGIEGCKSKGCEIWKKEKMKPKFVILEGIKDHNRFFSMNVGDTTRSENGDIWYNILGYAETVEEAQRILYKRRLLWE